MHIGIVALGSRGDVQPYIALGLGLVRAGHTVRIITHAVFEPFVRSYGLDFGLVRQNPQQALQSETGQAAIHNANPLRSLTHFLTLIRTSLPEIFADTLAAARGCEALLSSPLGFYCAPHIAEALRVPLINAYYLPVHATSAFPHYLFPTRMPRGPRYNRLTYLPDRLFGWMPFWRVTNACRRSVLDLPPLSPRALSTLNDRYPMLYGFSPSVIPPPPDWGASIHVTGYWFLDRPADWQPPAALVDFLSSGPQPIYVGFGSMNSRQAEETTALVLDALDRTQTRAVLSTGWGGLSAASSSDTVFVIDSVPHDWLFPQIGAVIHHAGAGTTAAGLRAGVPTICVPFYLDQPFWANRVAQLGVGPEPLPRKALTAAKLAGRIGRCQYDPDIYAAALALGEKIRAEDGVRVAVDHINAILASS